MKIKQNDRIVMDKKLQQKLVLDTKEKLDITWTDLSKRLKVSRSILREGYANGKITLSYRIFKKLCTLSELKESKITKEIREIKKKNWGQILGGKIGGRASKIVIKKKINYPIVSEKLAEFIGIVLGDGSLDFRNNTLQISLNRSVDSAYVGYVKSLIFDLFGIEPRIYNNKNDNVSILRANSKLLMDYMRIFNLNKRKIPKIFSKDKNLLFAVLRGLFDTDGSIFMSSKWCVLDFTNNSRLLKEFQRCMKSFGIPCFISSNHVNITSLWKIKRFMNLIGSSNMKNIIKFEEYYNNKVSLKNRDVVKLFSKYQNFQLPYKFGIVAELG